MAKEIDPLFIEQEYNNIRAKFQTLCNEVVRQIEHSIENKGIKLAVPIQSRAKTVISVLEKVRSGRFSIKKSVLEFQDLAGIRIITLFKRDAALAESIIDEIFDIKRKYNLAEKLTASEFGYLSTHMICTLKDEWTKLPTMNGLKDLTFEVQVRTLSQHSWAEVSKAFNYKNEDNVPQPVLRSINRISALLETVDLEFERLLDERENYISDFSVSEDKDEYLNVDSLEIVLDKLLPQENKFKNENYSNLLMDLNIFKIISIKDIEKLINKHLEKVIEIDNNMAIFNSTNSLERQKLGVFYSHAGLIREILESEFTDKWKSYNTIASKIRNEKNLI